MVRYTGIIEGKKVIVATIPAIQHYNEWFGASNFAVVLVHDRENCDSPDPIFTFTKTAVLNGADILIAAGKNSETTHELFDEEICDLSMNDMLNLKNNNCILTVFLKSQSINNIIDESIFPYKCTTIFFILLEHDKRINKFIKYLTSNVCSASDELTDKG